MAGLRLDGVRPKVLEPVDLTLEAGELVLLSGPSGSGKSLLLRAVADLDPHEGEVWLDGDPLIDVSIADRKVSLRPGDIEMSVPFGISAWQTRAALRDIRIRPLDPGEIPATPKPGR